MNKYSLITLLCLVFATGLFAEPAESNFYKETIHLVDASVDLVKDYGANASDKRDDSEALQKAIDDMTKLSKGGKIRIPSGNYYLMDIELKSNVHLEIDKSAVIFPTTPTGIIFKMGLDRKGEDAHVTIKNVSIRGIGGPYTVDLRSGRVNEKLSFANCRNVDNFLIADFNVKDNYTKLSCVTINMAEHDGKFFRACNGIVKNGDVTKAHVGYGLIQAQLGYHILFKNLSGQGGVTLRLESGAVTKSTVEMNIDDLYARNISSRNGSSAFIMGAHAKVHGAVYIDGVETFGSAFAGGIGRGFTTREQAAEGYTAGHFSSRSIVKNVHAVYGTNATIKSKNLRLVPSKISHLVSKTKGPDGVSYKSPSIAAVKYSDPNITLMNVTAEGFEHQPFPVIVDKKKIKDPKVLEKLLSIIKSLK